MIEFNYLGLDLIFHPKIKPDSRFHFYMKYRPEMGFYDKDLYNVFGRPTTKNYLEVLDGYIKASPMRYTTIKDNAEFIAAEIKKDKEKIY